LSRRKSKKVKILGSPLPHKLFIHKELPTQLALVEGNNLRELKWFKENG